MTKPDRSPQDYFRSAIIDRVCEAVELALDGNRDDATTLLATDGQPVSPRENVLLAIIEYYARVLEDQASYSSFDLLFDIRQNLDILPKPLTETPDGAEQLLKIILSEGPVPYNQIVESANDLGVSVAALKRASLKLGIISTAARTGWAPDRTWQLPDARAWSATLILRDYGHMPVRDFSPRYNERGHDLADLRANATKLGVRFFHRGGTEYVKLIGA